MSQTPDRVRPSVWRLLQGRAASVSPTELLTTGRQAAVFFIRDFLDNKCLSLASALSYALVLSIVPFLAVAFSITKGLGMYSGPVVRELLLKATAGREAVADAILEYVSNTNVQALGVMGTAMLLFTAVSLTGTIESAFNGIWKVREKRKFWRKFTNSLTVILVCPVLVFTAISVTATVESNAAFQWLMRFSVISQAYALFLGLLPYLAVWAAFFLVYVFLPNAKTGIVAPLAGALAAGSLWQLTQWAYVKYQIGVGNYNAIYGGFSQIPLLLAWVYVSWVIVLGGAQLSYILASLPQLLREAQLAAMSRADENRLFLLVMLLLTRNMEQRLHPPTAESLSDLFQIPARRIENGLTAFEKRGLTARTRSGDGAPGFLLAASPDGITAGEILGVLDATRPASAAPAFEAAFPFLDRLDALTARRDDRDGPNLRELLDALAAPLEEALAKAARRC